MLDSDHRCHDLHASTRISLLALCFAGIVLPAVVACLPQVDVAIWPWIVSAAACLILLGWLGTEVAWRVLRQGDSSRTRTVNLISIDGLCNEVAAFLGHGLKGRRLVALVGMSTRATDADSGVRQMLPLIAGYTGSTRVISYTVDGGQVADEPSAVWPATPGPALESFANDLHEAVSTGRIIVSGRWTCVPVAGRDRVRLLVLLESCRRDPIRRNWLRASAAEIQLQLGGLLTRLELIETLQELSLTDELTALPNRRALDERLRHDLDVAGRARTALSVCMIDLDHFKDYNDTFGHLAGDEVLREVAHILQSCRRSADFVGRYGGEEFCAVLPTTSAADAATLLRKLRRRCWELDAERRVTFSAGIAEWNHSESAAELMHRADQALYRAKGSGRDRSQIAADNELQFNAPASTPS